MWEFDLWKNGEGVMDIRMLDPDEPGYFLNFRNPCLIMSIML